MSEGKVNVGFKSGTSIWNSTQGSAQGRVGKGMVDKGKVVRHEKGHIYNINLLAWDFVDSCSGEDCPLYEICEYKGRPALKKERSWNNPESRYYTEKCILQQKYLKNVMSGVVTSFKNKEEITEKTMLFIGYHIVPLYTQLFKFKCWEYANKELVYVSEKGTPKVHPVYKEIREIIKTVHQMWKDFDGDKRKVDPAKVGDESFIDAMFQEVDDYSPEGDGGGGDSDGEVSENGQAMDFGEESGGGEDTEKGAGIDFGDLDTGGVEKMNRRGKIYRTPGTTKAKKRYKTKKKKKEPKKRVPGYCQSKNPFKDKNAESSEDTSAQSSGGASKRKRVRK